uniref:Variant surface glycoprotein n=1 Tax=Trypanosoma brucei TaxID=5691 RepID=S5FWS0_9TRYP|nr:variant surface glycoprotein [Trypanosoma brucei]
MIRLGCFAAVILLAQRTEAVAATGTNAADFALLCDLYNALKTQPATARSKQVVETIAHDVGSLNISAAPPDFTAKIDTSKDFSALKNEEKPKDPVTLANWEKYYNFWMNSKKRLETRTKAGLDLNLKDLKPEQKAMIRAYAEKAFEMLIDPTFAMAANASAAFTNKANEAIYGKGKAESDDPAATGNQRATDCGTTGKTKGSKAGLALREDFLCLCAKANANAVSNICCANCDTTDGTAWTTQTSGKTIFSHLIKECDKTKLKTTDIAAAIRSGIAAFKRRIAAPQADNSKTRFVLGGLNGDASTGCDGTSQATGGACVNYREGAGQTQERPIIDWETAAEEAAQAAESVNVLNGKLDLLAIKAENINETAHSIIALKIPEKNGLFTNPGKEKPSDHKQKECEAIKKAKLCKEKKPLCEWKGENDEDGPHCKLNTTAAEQQATQAGTTGEKKEGPASTGCARHGTDKTACENDKTGDKQNCAWRKGKEGETDEPEKEKCRNGSFLLTKKFALSVVSAAFMALLF